MKKKLTFFMIFLAAAILVSLSFSFSLNKKTQKYILPNGWESIRFSKQTGVFSLECDGTYVMEKKEAVIGFSLYSKDKYDQMAGAVRITQAGLVDALNGTSYKSLQNLRINSGDPFKIRMLIDVPKCKYSAFITMPDRTEQTIYEDMDFSPDYTSGIGIDSIVIASETGVISFEDVDISRGKGKSINHIWAVNDGERIRRDDLNNPNKQGNSTWDGNKIKLFGGRNEIIAFQLIVESGEKGIHELSASLPELSQKGGKSKILYSPPDKDPTLYYGRPIQIFSENYVYVPSATNASWISPPYGPSASKDPLGWKPVQLVPENAKPGKGGFPLEVKPFQNQGIWIEFYTDKDLDSGVYNGVITVTADGKTTKVPLEFELFDFTLPDENSMNAMLYFESDQPVEYHGSNMDEAYHRFAHRNRCEFVNAYDINTAKLRMDRFTGKDFTSDNGYEGPGEGIGNVIIPRTFYGPGKLFDDRDSAWKASNEWIEFLNENLPGKITFIYMPDEPSFSQFPYIKSLSENIKSNPGPGKDLPILVTKAYDSTLDGKENSIDIWCTPTSNFLLELAKKEREHGDDMWVYNGNRPFAGSLIYETPGTDARANIWGCFKMDIKVYFYWHSVHWRHNHQMPPDLDKRQNVWSEPITFRTGVSERANGDGVLVYPGEEKVHPDEDRGIEGPCSSIQMANIRRGMQDHLYLTMAKELGMDQLVKEVLEEVVPNILNPASTSVPGFAQDGNTFEIARYKLAKALSGTKLK